MSYNNLNDFINLLESSGELKRVSSEVSSFLEITEIANRVVKANGPALLFENVRGYSHPLLINAFGSYKRTALALNCTNIEEQALRIRELVHTAPPSSLRDKFKLLGTLKDVAGFLPKKVKSAPCQELIFTDGALLDRLPILHCWPQDGGPFITLPVVISADPDSSIQNYGMYRNQKFSNSTLGLHWQYNKGGAAHYKKYCDRNVQMPIAIALGGIPSVTYAATAPLPPEIDEMLFAGFLENKGIELVKGKTVDLWVPAESDFIIEGFCSPGELVTEGPFGDHTGFYSPADSYPVMHVTAVTMRRNAVFPATVVGKPPMEDCFLAKATERLFLPLLQMIVPEIVDIELPLEGVFHNCALVSIKKEYAGQGKKVINALWGLMQMSPTKFIAVFDEDTNLRDYSYCVWRLLNNVDPRRDMLVSDGPLDALDHSASFPNYGGKLGFDATRKSREEGMGRDWPEEINMSEDIIDLVNKHWKDYGIE